MSTPHEATHSACCECRACTPYNPCDRRIAADLDWVVIGMLSGIIAAALLYLFQHRAGVVALAHWLFG